MDYCNVMEISAKYSDNMFKLGKITNKSMYEFTFKKIHYTKCYRDRKPR